jgi:hypothetical protein
MKPLTQRNVVPVLIGSARPTTFETRDVLSETGQRREVHFNRVLAELHDTEKKYNGLITGCLTEKDIQFLKAANVIDGETETLLKKAAICIKELAKLSSEISADLQEARTNPDRAPEIIAKAFNDDRLNRYRTVMSYYMVNFDNLNAALTKVRTNVGTEKANLRSLAAKNPDDQIIKSKLKFLSEDIDKILDRLDMNRGGGKYSLESYLIMPVQRGPRYELLLKELSKYSGSEKDPFGKVRGEVHITVDRLNSLRKLPQANKPAELTATTASATQKTAAEATSAAPREVARTTSEKRMTLTRTITGIFGRHRKEIAGNEDIMRTV